MNIILSIALALALGGLGWVSTVSDARINTLKEQLAAAKGNAERWRVTAEALQGRVHGQNDLVEACLQREADALADVDTRQRIMTLAPPVPITPEQRATGVSHETRRAAADYLNRPL